MTRTSKIRLQQHIIFGTLIAAMAGLAHAGAPGSLDDPEFGQTMMLIQPDTEFDPAPDLSPAEIRNAVSVRMDRLEAQGFRVDRASVDGIGLRPALEQMVEIQID